MVSVDNIGFIVCIAFGYVVYNVENLLRIFILYWWICE